MATARRIGMALCASITPASTYLIGAAFGNRVHGTVLYAKQSVEDQCVIDLKFGARVAGLRALCLAQFEKGRS
jgi:chromosomal replication initiation ATPase DnaA